MTINELFAAFSEKSTRAAMVRLSEEIYIASGFSVLQRPCLPEEMALAEGKGLPYGTIPLWPLNDPGSVRPEVMLEQDRVELPADMKVVLDGMAKQPEGDFGSFPCIDPETGEPRLWFANLRADGVAETVAHLSLNNTDVMRALPLLISMPQPALSKFFSELRHDPADGGWLMAGDTQIRVYFCVLRIKQAFGIRIEDDHTSITLAPSRMNIPRITKVLLSDRLLYSCEGWDSKEFTYKTIKRIKGQKKPMKSTALATPPSAALSPEMAKLRAASATAAAAAPAPAPVAAAPVAPAPVAPPPPAAMPAGPAVVTASAVLPPEDLNGAVIGVDDALPAFTEPDQTEHTAVAIEQPGTAAAPIPAAVVPQAAAAGPEKTPGTRTRKQPKAVGFDFSKVQEYLASPVPELSSEELPAAMEELRTLRDLIIVASRRSANISLAIAANSEKALALYSQVKALVK